MDTTEKRAVITGGASGIGWAIARALLERGGQVVIADWDEARLAECDDASEPWADRLHAVRCDITDSAQLEALADTAWERLGGLDLLFANAGVGLPIVPLLEQSEGRARWVFEVNFFGTFKTLQTFAPRMIAQGTPCHLTVTGSENSICVPAPLLGAYNASKHALLGMTETLARETPDFVGVSLLCPALVRSNIAASVTRIPDSFGGPAEAREGLDLGFTPEQVATAALKGIENGDFYVFTHHCNREMIEERMTEQLQAIDEQTSPDDGSDACNVRPLLGALFEHIYGNK